MPNVVVIGSYNRDLIFATDHLPVSGETRLGSFASSHGGKGFNQAIAACRLSAPTLFVGALGEDSYAAEAREFARAEGLSCRWQTTAAGTGLACVLTDPAGNNQIVVAPGANEDLGREHVAAIAPVIQAAQVLLTQLECNLGAISQGLETARAAGVTTILNPAPIRDAVTLDLISLADVMTPNESEFADLLDRLWRTRMPAGWESTEDEQLHAWCRLTGIGTLVITLGERGCFVSHAAHSRYADDETWELVPLSDPQGDGHPGPRMDQAMAYHEGLERTYKWYLANGSTARR